ncbi:hypothetical protein ACFYXC_27550 [Streptomyces sp. NPDC002701]|uniref:hypothetical protein n=1 Tax=Streptomyces sp. NPDC002701 TaxID=3364661 RepID=UPI0036B5E8CE
MSSHTLIEVAAPKDAVPATASAPDFALGALPHEVAGARSPSRWRHRWRVLPPWAVDRPAGNGSHERVPEPWDPSSAAVPTSRTKQPGLPQI